jgi:hypothetical protein
MTALTVECEVHFIKERRGRRMEIKDGTCPQVLKLPSGRIPWISRLLALAISLEERLRAGIFRDYAEIARLGHVSRARVMQLMNLSQLAPDIQEEILFLPRTERGRDAVGEREIRRILKENDWQEQRELWRKRFWIDPGSQ